MPNLTHTLIALVTFPSVIKGSSGEQTGTSKTICSLSNQQPPLLARKLQLGPKAIKKMAQLQFFCQPQSRFPIILLANGSFRRMLVKALNNNKNRIFQLLGNWLVILSSPGWVFPYPGRQNGLPSFAMWYVVKRCRYANKVNKLSRFSMYSEKKIFTCDVVHNGSWEGFATEN